MKKVLIILLSFLAYTSHAQAEFPESVQLTNVISTTSPFVNVQSSTGVVNKINKTDLVDAIIVNTTAELTPAIGNVNKLYATRDNTLIYRYNGTIYVPIGGGDVSGKEDIANKQNSLAADGTNTKYPTVTAVNTLKRYTKEITVGAGGTYATLELLFANEPAGKTLIKLIDANYSSTNPQFVVKNGWIIQGQGYGKTNLTFNFTTAIDTNLSGLQIRTDCELIDFKVTSINNTNVGGFSQYALHSDFNGAFTAKITRCWFKTVASPNVVDANGYNGLSVGVGTWEGQVLEFHESILQGQSVSIDNKYTLNLHNTFVSAIHSIPSRVSFYNSQLTGGFTTLVISDTYSNSSESDSSRVKDLFEFVGCEIKGGIYLRSANQLGGADRKNGLAFNFSGTNVDEFINVGEIVNTSLSNYDVTSLPLTKDVDFQKNLGVSMINEGDFVSYVYGNRIDEYHRANVILSPIGVEKLNATNVKYFAGISLTSSAVGNFTHIAKGAIAYTKDAFPNIEIQAKLAFNDNGVLVKSSISGIGTVIKKTTDNRLGIFLTPNGRKENTIGTYLDRGILEIAGNSGGVGQPSIFMSDKNILNEFTNYAINVGSHSEVFPFYEKGRFSINDNLARAERLAIKGDGRVFVNKKLIINGFEGVQDEVAYSALPSLQVFGKNKVIGVSPEDQGNLQISTTDPQGANIGAGISLGGVYNSSRSIVSFAKMYGKKETSVSGSYDGKLVFETSNNTTVPYSSEVGSFSSTGVFKINGLSGTGARLVFADASGNLSASSTVTTSLLKTTVYTVATLPTPPSTGTGTYATVSDAVAPAYLTPVMGGGAVITPVFYNGSNWICH